jgi:hypothetical protein
MAHLKITFGVWVWWVWGCGGVGGVVGVVCVMCVVCVGVWGCGGGGCFPLRSNIPRSALCATLDTYNLLFPMQC